MPIQSTLYGKVRGGLGVTDERAVDMNESREMLTAQGLPAYTEMSRLGNGWTLLSAAFAPVAAVPSTTAAQEIFNNSTGSGAMVMVIVDIFAFQLLSTAAVQTYAAWAQVTTQKAAPTNGAQTFASVSGRQSWATTASSPLLTAAGTTVVANGWRPFGSVQSWGTAAATPGGSWSAPVDGKLLVPPGCSLCLTVAGSIATASSFQVGFQFYFAPITTSLTT
jgi:hypothetical protein